MCMYQARAIWSSYPIHPSLPARFCPHQYYRVLSRNRVLDRRALLIHFSDLLLCIPEAQTLVSSSPAPSFLFRNQKLFVCVLESVYHFQNEFPGVNFYILSVSLGSFSSFVCPHSVWPYPGSSMSLEKALCYSFGCLILPCVDKYIKHLLLSCLWRCPFWFLPCLGICKASCMKARMQVSLRMRIFLCV